MSEADKTQQALRNTNFNLLKNTFSRDGFEFIGWSESETATTPTYTDEQLVNFPSNKTLYAIWKENVVKRGKWSGVGLYSSYYCYHSGYKGYQPGGPYVVNNISDYTWNDEVQGYWKGSQIHYFNTTLTKLDNKDIHFSLIVNDQFLTATIEKTIPFSEYGETNSFTIRAGKGTLPDGTKVSDSIFINWKTTPTQNMIDYGVWCDMRFTWGK